MTSQMIHRFNVVILPINDAPGDARRYQISANSPGYLRMVSPAWSEYETRSAFAAAGITQPQIDELFRGNRMVFGGRDPRYIFFGEEQLQQIGLSPVEVPVGVPAEVPAEVPADQAVEAPAEA